MKASGLSNCSSKLNEPRDVVMVIYSITLTLNEEKHIERSISSVLKVGAKPIIVDCGSISDAANCIVKLPKPSYTSNIGYASPLDKGLNVG